jgi:methylated-DNA-protein-cysteine methyltransferase related protein
MINKGKIEEKLKRVKPSGEKDDSFFELVFDIVRHIPKGRVTSYGAIAAALGTRSSARMVGWAMNSSHHPSLKVPAHRVVNRKGLLTGKMHFDYPEQMQELPEKEGVKVVDDQVQDFVKIFWDPVKELGL